MAVINVLSQETINQIAAGEVVERPASVVKELLENAVDAGASAVTVEIKEGGIGLIRITDNGSGIEHDQIRTAFLRHATSKITSAADLLSLKSLGFRGEALSSICAVSQVELLTKTRSSLSGSRYVIEGGEEKSLQEIGCPDGTTFLIRNLFYNVPARRKFLKSPATEAGYINDLVERIAVSHPEVAFKFINNGKLAVQTSGNRNVKDILYHIYGRDIAAQLVEVNYEEGGILVEGFLAKPVVSRGNRNYENYFINGRYIKSAVITRAIEDAYKPFTMTHKYPFTALHYTLETDSFDVNVHPTKMEVRFDDPELLYLVTKKAVSAALSGKSMIPAAKIGTDREIRQEEKEKQKEESKLKLHAPAPEPFEKKRMDDLLNESRKFLAHSQDSFAEMVKENAEYGAKALSSTSVESKPDISKSPEITETLGTSKTLELSKTSESSKTLEPSKTSEPQNVPEDGQLSFEKTDLDFKESTTHRNYRIIGQLFSTYWLLEIENGLYIIDQHAAHEKILYERTMNTIASKEFLSQMVSPPIIITLSMREEAVLKEHLEVLTRLGFEIEPFGGREYSVTAVPADQFGIAGEALLLELIDSLVEEGVKGTSDMVLEKVASLSCKAAVKGNHGMSEQEARALITDLMALENPYHCPHGRPVIISMSKYEIEKKFKRIV